MQNNDQKGSLSDKFRDFGAAPSDGLWSAIEQQLDEKKKRRFPFWWWTTGLAACFIAGFLLLRTIPDNTTRVSGKNTKEKTNKVVKQKPEMLPTPSLSQKAQTNPSYTFTFDEKMLLNWLKNHNNHYQDSYYGTFPSFPVENQITHNISETSIIPSDSTNTATIIDSSDVHDSSVLPGLVRPHIQPIIPPGKSGFWTISCAAGYSERIGAETAYENWNANEMDVLTLIPPTPGNPAGNKTLKQQWSAEILVSRQLSRRFSLQTGIEGSFYSTGTIQGSSASISGKATGMSVGIPLYVNYSLISYKRLEWYAGTGIQHNFAFSKTLETTTTYPNSIITTSETINPRGQLTSGQIHTGIRFRFYRSASLEVKPLMRYYFREKLSNTETFLGKRYWFGGTVGVVWRF